MDRIQNDASRSTVAPYSPRAARWPLVSMPVTWAEIDAAVAAQDPRMLVFTMREAVERVAERGDLFAPVLGAGATLPG